MVKLLLKKQLAEIFRVYFYNQKTNKKRAKTTTILFFVSYAILLLGVFGGIFGFVANMLCTPFYSINLAWMYFVIMGLIAIALGAFGSIFNTYAGLYLAKDNDLLLSLPIPVSAIMASRLLSVYVMGLMYSGIVSLSAVIIYLWVAGFSVKTLVCGLLFVFIISLLVLILSCLLGWVVAKVSQKLKNKSFITVLVSLVGIGLYYFCYFKAQTVLTNLITNAQIYGQKLKGSAYILYTFGRIGEGSWLATGCWLIGILALLALTWCLLKRSFLKIATSSASPTSSKRSEQKKAEEGTRKCRSLESALFNKELSRFTSSAGYMLNCSLGTLFLLILCVTMLIKASFIEQFILQCEVSSNFVLALGACIICLVASMNVIAEPSISLEGKNLWILQTLPVAPQKILKAKLFVHLLLTAVPSALCVIVMTIILGLNFVQFLLGLAFVLGFVLLLALLNLMLGLKLPNLNWTNEMVPIKQGFGVFIALFAGWIFMAAIVVLYLFFGNGLGEFIYLIICTIVCWLLCLVLGLWLNKQGSAIFARL